MQNHSETADMSADVVITGLNINTLAIAVALADRKPSLKVILLDTSSNGRPQYISNLKGHVHTTFMQDLITMSNPRSHFTYVNYLHQHKRLAGFLNVSSMQPLRLEIQDYLRWVTEEIAKLGWIRHVTKGIYVEPCKDSLTGKVAHSRVEYIDAGTGSHQHIRTKRVIVAKDPSSVVPHCLRGADVRRFIRSVEKAQTIAAALTSSPKHFAIVGSSEHAAELFSQLQSSSIPHRVTWYIEEPYLRPIESTPFTRSALDEPDKAHASLPPDLRHKLARDVSGASNRISLHRLEAIYEARYSTRINPSADPSASTRCTIVPNTIVQNATVTDDKVTLSYLNTDTSVAATSSDAFDLIVDGAALKAHLAVCGVLEAVRPLTEARNMDVGPDYRLALSRRACSREVGVWLVGSLDARAQEDVLVYVAEQAARVASSVFEAVETKVEVQRSVLVDSVL